MHDERDEMATPSFRYECPEGSQKKMKKMAVKEEAKVQQNTENEQLDFMINSMIDSSSDNISDNTD